jgi:hypothetical protein
LIKDWLNAYQPKSKDWQEGTELTSEILQRLIQNKIQEVSFLQIQDDVVRFIPDREPLKIWSKEYFSDLVRHIKME